MRCITCGIFAILSDTCTTRTVCSLYLAFAQMCLAKNVVYMIRNYLYLVYMFCWIYALSYQECSACCSPTHDQTIHAYTEINISIQQVKNNISNLGCTCSATKLSIVSYAKQHRCNVKQQADYVLFDVVSYVASYCPSKT